MNKKVGRELETMAIMIAMYCRSNHNQKSVPCIQCKELYAYARDRIQKCKLGDKKTTCARCSTHCFKPDYRKSIRQVMRFSGPRMIYKHPYMSIRHLLDSISEF